jgi:putative FmdB family regulatory protein
MPIYEYRCPECDHQFEQLRRMSEADEKAACPKCRSEKPTRQLSCFCAATTSSGSSGASMGGNCGARGGFT